MLNVLIARHAQSEWNAAGRWQGQADPPLSESGVEQARRAAQLGGSFAAVVSSDLDRALTTARIIAEGIGVGPVLVEPAFRERHAGDYQGLTRDEIEARYPGDLDAGIRPPGWEPEEALLTRVLEGLERLVAEVVAGDVLLVSHGGVIYALEHHLGLPHERIANLGGRWFHRRDDRWTLGERVRLVPDEVAIDNQDIL